MKKPAKESGTARVTKKEKATAKLISQFAEMQQSSQESMMKRELKIQRDVMKFQANMEKD